MGERERVEDLVVALRAHDHNSSFVADVERVLDSDSVGDAMHKTPGHVPQRLVACPRRDVVVELTRRAGHDVGVLGEQKHALLVDHLHIHREHARVWQWNLFPVVRSCRPRIEMIQVGLRIDPPVKPLRVTDNAHDTRDRHQVQC